MSHLLRLPVGGPYTTTVTLNPALVLAQEENLEPVQRFREAPDGTHWVFQLSTNVRQTIELDITELPDADFSGFSGYQTLKTFFLASTLWSFNRFDFTHSDGGTTTVRLASAWQFIETQKDRWTGRISLRKHF